MPQEKPRFGARITALLCALALSGALVWWVALRPAALPGETPTDVSHGVSFLSELERQDPAAVDEAVRRLREQRLEQSRAQEEKEAKARASSAASSGNKTGASSSASSKPARPTFVGEGIWAGFSDYVILGDSRAVGFSYYKFLDRSRVLAGGGDTIRNVAEHLGEIKRLRPSYVFLCYGLNDAGIGYWKTGKAYAAEMVQVVASIRKAAPGAQVIVSSVLPATDAALRRSPSWNRIADFNAHLRKVCPANGISFVDNDSIAYALMDEMWQPDGVHLKPAFYPYWGKNLLAAIAVESTVTPTDVKRR